MNGVINAESHDCGRDSSEAGRRIQGYGKQEEYGRHRKSLQNFDSSMKQNKCEKGEEDAGCY